MPVALTRVNRTATEMAPSTRQPVRTFDREILTTREQKVYDTNASNSRLLRLPPEIRNRIYTLALGEREIHIGQHIRMQDQKIPFHSVCEYGVRTRDLTNSIIKDGTEIGHENWAGVHHQCFFRFGEPYTSLQVQLLGVCRQIYQEASLIPFTSNTFIFIDGLAMTTLADKLSAEQNVALANMCLTMVPGSMDLFPVPDKKDVDRFTGLKHLTILGWIPVRGLIPTWAQYIVRQTFERTKEALQAVRWASAVVCLTSVSKFDLFDGQVLEDGNYRAESMALERALLETGSDETGTEDGDNGKVGREDVSVQGCVEGDIMGNAEDRGVIDGNAADSRVEQAKSAAGDESTGEDVAPSAAEQDEKNSKTGIHGAQYGKEEKARGESEQRETFRGRRGLRKLQAQD